MVPRQTIAAYRTAAAVFPAFQMSDSLIMRSTTSHATPWNATPCSRDSNAASSVRSSDNRSIGSLSRCIAHFKIKLKPRISRLSTSGGAPSTSAPSVRCPAQSPIHVSCSTAS